jgi:DUF2075 family protein
MNAWYSAKVGDFLSLPEESVFGLINTGLSKSGFSRSYTKSQQAWLKEITHLKEVFKSLQESTPTVNSWGLAIEFELPRLQKRLDVVLLAKDIIFVIEYKVGAEAYSSVDVDQVEDYALDLRDFHSGSRAKTIVPVLVSTKAPAKENSFKKGKDYVKPVVLANEGNLSTSIIDALKAYSNEEVASPCLVEWLAAEYYPVPTIIQAATALYANMNVREIARSYADPKNLAETADCILRIIHRCRDKKKKAVCFVTGVPGSGKTLAGLNVVHNPQIRENPEEPAGSFLTGNGPLVNILREAIARDASTREKTKIKDERHKVSTFIQNVHQFIGVYFKDGQFVKPPDHVVIFDEAQRAWDEAQVLRKERGDRSEARMMLGVLDQHSDWAVLIALVGGGQEINDGEAGLGEWGKALESHFSHWEIFASPRVLDGGEGLSGTLLYPAENPRCSFLTKEEDLHLKVSLRSYKAKTLNKWVDCVLNDDPLGAAALLAEVPDYPLFITRDLEVARKWLKDKCRGSRRVGLLASSGARRLRGEGLYLSSVNDDYVEWFLNPKNDVRSSYYLEVAATEYECQGLELDWTGLCWGGDFYRGGSAEWAFRQFKGTAWQNVRDLKKREFLRNKYRVLLSRAREGMVIWVPRGSVEDATREPLIYDDISAYLAKCGVKQVPLYV